MICQQVIPTMKTFPLLRQTPAVSLHLAASVSSPEQNQIRLGGVRVIKWSRYPPPASSWETTRMKGFPVKPAQKNRCLLWFPVGQINAATSVLSSAESRGGPSPFRALGEQPFSLEQTGSTATQETRMDINSQFPKQIKQKIHLKGIKEDFHRFFGTPTLSTLKEVGSQYLYINI